MVRDEPRIAFIAEQKLPYQPLTYEEKIANNDHVFRHRAPLVMAQVNPDRMCVLREAERIVIPERGAWLGNFGITEVSPR